MKNKTAIALFLIVTLFAAYLRLYGIDLAEFKSDEARDAFVARNFVENGTIPLVGAPTSVGGNAGPFYYFILSLPFLISANPIVSSAFVALLNVLAVSLTFIFAKDFFNERIALIASALAAVSPFAIIYSRKIWNPDLLFPFSTILLYSIYSFAINKKPKYVIPIFLSFSILLQLHPVTLFLLPAILFVLFKFRKIVSIKYMAVGIVISILLFSPFILSEFQNNFKTTNALVSTSGLYDFSKINTISIQHIASLTSGTGFDYILGDSSKAFYSSIFNVQQFFFVENILLFFGFVLVFYLSAKKTFSLNFKYSFLVLWFLIPVLILLFFTGPQYPHHLIMLYPAQFLIIGILFDFVLQKSKKIKYGWHVKILTLLLLAFILSIQFAFDYGFLNFLQTNGGTTDFYEIGVLYKIEVAKYVASTPGNFSLSYSLKPNDIGLEYKYLLTLFNRTVSDYPSVQYVVVNSLNPSMNLSQYQKVNFGPLTLYSIR